MLAFPSDLPPPAPCSGPIRGRRRGTPVGARAVAPLLIAIAALVAGCADHMCVATVEGCVGPLTYKRNAASVAADIQSTPRLEDRWALETINVADAWAHLQVVHGEERPGSGVTVGVLDTGIDLSHPTFIDPAR